MTGKDNNTMNGYIAPEIEIIEFENEDVITASVFTGDDEMPLIDF